MGPAVSESAEPRERAGGERIEQAFGDLAPTGEVFDKVGATSRPGALPRNFDFNDRLSEPKACWVGYGFY